nr:DUF222 domain-containing protein [Tessaracoccus coleopterorum]
MLDGPFPNTRDEAIARLEQGLHLWNSPQTSGTPEHELEQLAQLNTLIDRLLATRSLAISDADKRRVAETATGLTMAVWLKSTRRATKGEATGIIFAGHDLAAHPEVGKAAVDGTVSTRQAACITAMLDDLPSRLSVEQQGRAAEFLVAKAANLDTNSLKRLASEALDVADPVESEADAAQREQVRLEAQQRRAERNRAFRYHYDDGSLHFSGQVPAVDGAELVRLVEARVEAVKRATRDDRRGADVGRPEVTPEQRAADAFMAIIRGHDTSGVRVAQDRARVVVHLDEETLRRRVEQAGVLPSGRRSAQVSCGACAATLTSPPSSWAPPLRYSIWAGRGGWCPMRCASRSASVTAAARSPAATPPTMSVRPPHGSVVGRRCHHPRQSRPAVSEAPQTGRATPDAPPARQTSRRNPNLWAGLCPGAVGSPDQSARDARVPSPGTARPDTLPDPGHGTLPLTV